MHDNIPTAPPHLTDVDPEERQGKELANLGGHLSGARRNKREASVLLIPCTSDGDSPSLAWVHMSHRLGRGPLGPPSSRHPQFSLWDLAKNSGSQLWLCVGGKELKDMNKLHKRYPAIQELISSTHHLVWKSNYRRCTSHKLKNNGSRCELCFQIPISFASISLLISTISSTGNIQSHTK